MHCFILEEMKMADEKQPDRWGGGGPAWTPETIPPYVNNLTPEQAAELARKDIDVRAGLNHQADV